MLYKQNQAPFNTALFQNPTSEYRGTPFWAWNTKLKAEELTWQIEQFKKMGYGGAHLHVRTGMATDYLSDEYMELVKACVEKARTENMLAWLYDEDRWPSGAAGGLVTKNPSYRARHLLLTRKAYIPGNNVEGSIRSASEGIRAENGTLIACFDVRLHADGSLSGYRRIAENAEAQGFKLYAYEETALPSPWFNNQTYVNTLDPASIQEFIRITYERYNETIAKDFGGVVPAIFTDEPQFSHKQTLTYAHEDRDVTLPWTTDLPESYRAAYSAEVLDSLPELLWDLPDSKPSLARYRYHDHIAERFATAFADQCGAWCEAHGIALTGHMMEERNLTSQTAALGDCMRSYRAFQLPGIDMLCDQREYTTAKQAQSASRQFGREGVLSELYGVTNWDFDFRGHKLQGDWQAALGVTVRVPHLSWVSMNGEAKRDYPSTFNYQSPWYEQYAYVEDHFARVNTALTRGKAVCRVGVLHPIESYWLHWGASETTAATRNQMDANFESLTEWLLRGLIDFDFVNESLLPEQCKLSSIDKCGLPVGSMQYEVLLVPPVKTVRATTLDRIEALLDAGGRVIFLGRAPQLVDAVPSERAKAIWARGEHVAFDRLLLLDALSNVRDIDIFNRWGGPASNLMYQLREDADAKYLFIAQADSAKNPDCPDMDSLRIRIRGEYIPTLLDTLTGQTAPFPAEYINGDTVLHTPFFEHDSLLLRLEAGKTDKACALSAPLVFPALAPLRYTAPVPVTLHEPNVLLLDMAEYALDNEAYRPLEEVLRLDNALRKEIGWPSRGEAVAQPWVETDESTPHVLQLRYTFNSEIAVEGAKLALENAAATTVVCNGQKAGAVDGWYADKCIGTVALPALIPGANVLELTIPYGRKTDVEACYLLGSFGVRVEGIRCTLVAPVHALAFGDVTRQNLPFYGGNITYHTEAETTTGDLFINASYYRAHLLRVAVDGADAGVIAYSPYTLTVKGLAPGKHKVDITMFGNRINTFGQLHRNDRFNQWWGPDSWRSTGAAWTYEYRLWPQGLLKAPEFMD